MPTSLTVKLADLILKNPTILASGILGTTCGLMKRIEKAGAGAITTKTVTEKPREGFFNPVFVDLGFGYLNAMGLPNPGAYYFKEEIMKAKDSLNIPIIASIGGKDEKEFLKVAELMIEANCDALELNLSCPHVREYGLDIGSDVSLSKRITKEIKSISPRPVFVKISVSHAEREIVEKLLDSGIDGISAINTIRAMVIDVEAMIPVLSNVFGGLSGPCIRPIAVRVVYEIHREFPDIPIIGMGGIQDWRDALEFIMAGASAVGIGSAIAKKDLNIFKEIVEGIRAFLIRNNFNSIRDLIGCAHRR